MQLGDRSVNRLGFGAMRICGSDVWGEPADRDGAKRLLRRVVELGINVIDTADSYGPEISENLIAEALHPYPANLVIATKGGLTRPNRHAWERDARPEHLKRACDASLKRLRLESIPLYQLHAPDPKVAFADSVGALAQLQQAGKIQHIGLSNVSVAKLEEARRIVPIVSVQNRYNLEDRTHEDVLDACEKLGIAFLPWYPLGVGEALQSKAVRTIAARLRATPSQVALAWLLAKSPMMLPIPGTGSIAHLEENSAAAALTLSREDLAQLALQKGNAGV